MSTNQQTLQTYNVNPHLYIQGTPNVPSGVYKELLDYLSEHIPPNARVLEIGSGTGRDVRYLQSNGVNIEATDAAESFVQLMNDDGIKSCVLNVLEYKIPVESYNMIIATAVLLHFDEEELRVASRNIMNGLKHGGLFSFLVKKGKGEEWSSHKMNSPRYFKYWEEEDVDRYIQEYNLDLIRTRLVDNDKWFHVLARKHG